MKARTFSPALQAVGALMAVHNYAPMFPIELLEKDLGYALALAQMLGVVTPTLATAQAIYADARARPRPRQHRRG